MNRLFLLVILFFIVTSCAGDKPVAAEVASGDEPLFESTNWLDPEVTAQLNEPVGVALYKDSEVVILHRGKTAPDPFVADDVLIFVNRSDGTFLRGWGAGFFIKPHGLHVDKNNNFWVSDIGRHQVFKFTSSGELLMTLGVENEPGASESTFNMPTDIAVVDDGSIFVTDGYGNSRVVKFSADGVFLAEWGERGTADGQFHNPHCITVAPGPELVVADRENSRVQVFDLDGVHLRTVDFTAPVYAVDYHVPTGGLHAADYLVTPDTDIVGSALYNFNDGKVANLNGLDYDDQPHPCRFHDIVMDSDGGIFATDLLNHEVIYLMPGVSKQ